MPISKASVLKNLQKVAKLAPAEPIVKPKAQKSLLEAIVDIEKPKEQINELSDATLRSYVAKRGEMIKQGYVPTRKADEQKLYAARQHQYRSDRANIEGDKWKSSEYRKRASLLANMITSGFIRRGRQEKGIERAKGQLVGKDVLESKQKLKEHLLTELSKRTLTNYIKKSEREIPRLQTTSKLAITRANTGGSSEWINSNVAEYLKKISKIGRRRVGIERAKSQIGEN